MVGRLYNTGSPRLSTFSIAARDPLTGDLGVAVQSKFMAVGSVVPWAQANVGAIATQSYANTSYGPRGLELLRGGLPAAETLARLTLEDEDRRLRQVGIVSATGEAAAFTGEECFSWAGHVIGDGYCCQGNILVSADTVHAMAHAFEGTTGDLANRLVAALAAGQAAGGDRRGQQSAALLVVREGGGYAGYNDRLVDLRVDEHPAPIQELARLLDLYRLYFSKSDESELLPIDASLARELQRMLTDLGFHAADITGIYDEATKSSLWDFMSIENLEERQQDDAHIDPRVLQFLQDRWQGQALGK
ncbi:MAG: DUF1028 domain-containing protein [Anaerolineales bacterium]|nr:MAG: DUF1028 domain-containing protein [Anaerolineales bacterium]